MTMALFRIVIHGFALSGANIISIRVAFGVYNALKPAHPFVVQVPVAVVLSITIFLLWMLLVRISPFKFITVKTLKELSWIFLASLAWGPVIFIPLHYSSNITAIFQFQLPVNVLVMLVARITIRPQSK